MAPKTWAISADLVASQFSNNLVIPVEIPNKHSDLAIQVWFHLNMAPVYGSSTLLSVSHSSQYQLQTHFALIQPFSSLLQLYYQMTRIHFLYIWIVLKVYRGGLFNGISAAGSIPSICKINNLLSKKQATQLISSFLFTYQNNRDFNDWEHLTRHLPPFGLRIWLCSSEKIRFQRKTRTGAVNGYYSSHTHTLHVCTRQQSSTV